MMKNNKNILRTIGTGLTLGAIGGLALEIYSSAGKDGNFYLQTASASEISHWSQGFHRGQVEASLEGTFKDQPDDVLRQLQREAQDQVA
jgi:hypothetical protein